MGRRSLGRVKRKVSLPAATIAQVELLLLDPVTEKLRYGALSGLVTQLLNEWLRKQKKETTDATDQPTDEERQPGPRSLPSPEGQPAPHWSGPVSPGNVPSVSDFLRKGD